MDYQKEYLKKNPNMHLGDSAVKVQQLIMVIKPSSKIKSILDIACGAGNVTTELVKRYEPELAVGLDISKAMIAKAKKLDKEKLVKWVQSDIFSYKPSEYFDLATCVDILEHVEDDKGFLKRVSQFGKYIVIKTPLEDSWFNRVLRSMKLYDPWLDTQERYGHIHHYNEVQLNILIKTSGLKIIKSVSVPMPKRTKKIWEFFRLFFYPISLFSMEKMVEVSGGFKILLVTKASGK